MNTSEAAISGLSSELKSERELAQELEQGLHQRLDQERRRLQDQNKQKEEAVMKLNSLLT